MKMPEIEVLKCIESRISVRSFTDRSLPDSMADVLLNAGFCAPSASNMRPRHFIVISDRVNLQEIGRFGPNTKPFSGATLGIIICGDKAIQSNNELMMADCSAATQNILLAAHAQGIGAVWCGVLSDGPFFKYLIQKLDIPAPIIPVCSIALGYPAETRPPEPRFNPEKIHREYW